MSDDQFTPQPVPERPEAMPRNVMARATPANYENRQTEESMAGPQPQLMESIIMLVLLALVAWTCWLLYAPQLRGMIHFLISKP